MNCSCDAQTLRWLLRLPLALLSVPVSLVGCSVVLSGLVMAVVFRECQFPKVITQVGLMLMEAPCYVMRTCYRDQTATREEPQAREIAHRIFDKLPEPVPLSSFSTTFSSGKSGSGTSSNPSSSLTSLSSFSPSQTTFTYEELSAATDKFSTANLLGEGGYGYVYKGKLSDGREVAIKMLKGDKSWAAENELQAEAAVISRVHHRHLVSLVGLSVGQEKVMLVFEFVPNKTLQFHLHECNNIMDWPTRLKVALGSAKGLAYLHEECHPRIVHRDVKSSNILLDYSFESKVGDFGLAKYISDDNTHVSTRVMGTVGYLAPEYAMTGQLTDKSDVFSFGVMLLELISGKRPVMRNDTLHTAQSLVDWARPLMAQASVDGNFEILVDPRLENNYDHEEMKRMIACAGRCMHFFAPKRPHMSEVVRVLEGVVPPDEYIRGIVQFYQTPVSVLLGIPSDNSSSRES
ncbi:Proline-rich receptor-like protein kinase PERK4 [Rhynchospora pubera]|uniref:non-specific serine/threonine protein kinase n=1 Tax=Rhynchospora pubera TaxID=906938 RepID=A0AAV8CAU0_9POAL|nr:Proline-rich receptor-like protein kinase PERK4 [Rhynchospora pubera]